jgi:hypothetical protein
MLNVAREDFIPPHYRAHAYEEIPLPLPGERATISCPHSYLLFYEPLGLGVGHRFLEVGVGSGYGTALARSGGPRRSCRGHRAGRRNARLRPGEPGPGRLQRRDPRSRRRRTRTRRAGRLRPGLRHGGLPEHPAAANRAARGAGAAGAPVKDGTRQLLTLVEKTPAGVRREVLTDGLYVSVRGRYGVRSHRQG